MKTSSSKKMSTTFCQIKNKTKKIAPKMFLTKKNFCQQKLLQNILVEKCWSKANIGPKKFLSQTIFVQKEFGQKSWSKNFGLKELWSKNIFVNKSLL